MKVVFIADCLTTQRAGIFYYASQLLPRVVNYYQHHEYYHITAEPYEIVGSTNVVIPVKGSIPLHFRLRYFWEIPREIKSIGPDIVIEMAHFGPFRLPAQIRKYTVVYDLTPILFKKYHDLTSVLWHSWCFRRLLHRVDGLITISKTTADDIQRILAVEGDKILIQYPFIGSIHSTSVRDTDLSKPLQFLTVGTIEPRKRHLWTLKQLEAWYLDTGTAFKWVIVGQKGWDYDDFMSALEHSVVRPMIELRGYITDDDRDSLYACTDVYLFSSHYEGFGMPILEAMSYGCPVILSDTSIHREVAGDAAKYFSDSPELLNILSSINEDMLTKMSESSRNHFNNFDQELHLDFLL